MSLDDKEFMRAIFKGDVSEMVSFVEEGLNLQVLTEREKWNYLHRATVSVTLPIKIPTLNYLIDSGIDVNAKDVYGYTPLHYSSRVKNTDAINLLINAGAEVNVVNGEGVTPLQLTLSQKPFILGATEALLKSGASPDFPLASGEKTIRDYVDVISHGDDIFVKELFDKY